MFDTTFFREDLVTVVHKKGLRVTKKLLEDPNATFVWGELMDPYFIYGLLGHYVAFAPAVLPGFERRRTKEFFNAVKKPGASMQGAVLLGLSAVDVKKLNEFEKVGVVMRRTSAVVLTGHFRRRTALYLKKAQSGNSAKRSTSHLSRDRSRRKFRILYESLQPCTGADREIPPSGARLSWDSPQARAKLQHSAFSRSPPVCRCLFSHASLSLSSLL